MKSNRGAAKRFEATASAKVSRSKAYARHMLTHKTTTQKRGLRGGALVDASSIGSIQKMLPYLGAK